MTGVVVALGVLALPATAHVQSTIKWVPMKHLSVADGKYVYERECAVCHGTFGRGNGRASTLLGAPVPDLTLIAVRDGQYDERHVVRHVLDRRSHGGQMPNWRNNFNRACGGDRAVAHLVALNLTRHIESMQRTLD